MTDADLWAAWRLWMGVATLVVLIAAGLLITIWLTARKIFADAVRALNAVQAIRAQTQPLWGLQQTNEVAEDILGAVPAIENKATPPADATHMSAAPQLAGADSEWPRSPATPHISSVMPRSPSVAGGAAAVGLVGRRPAAC